MRVILDFFKTYAQNFLFAFIVVLGIITFGAISTYFYFAGDLVNKESILSNNDAGITLLDRNDRPFYTFYKAKRKVYIPLSEIPQNVQNAVIASEDKEFYKHPGFSVKSILRSVILNVQNKEIAYGGSTITQQLVKNVLLTSEKSFLRKYQEIILAEEIERRYSKKEILEMYLNSVYFGEGAFGVEEAAQTYFGKRAKDLDLAETSMLVGLLPSPSRLSPISGNKTLAKIRQTNVLREMYSQGYISRKDFLQAERRELNYNYTIDINRDATHFALFVKDQLIEKYGEEQISRSGYKIKTTINLDWQNHAENVVRNQVNNLRGNNVTNGAAVVLNPKTGEILAMVGSIGWQDDKFGKMNMAITPRQVGSSFKPIVYIAGFERQIITPATILRDQPTTFPGDYKPQNYDKKFRGNVTVRKALSNSLNVPSVQVLSMVGVPAGLEMAERLGISTLTDKNNYGLSLVLGTGEIKLLELTSAYSIFANRGYKNNPVSILYIENKLGEKIYEFNPAPEQVIKSEYTFLISSILSDKKARAEVFGNTLDIPRTAAVKTGTTENYRDSLTVGYTPSLAVGAWVGNNDNIPMDNIAGSLGAAPIWKALMDKFLEGTPDEGFNVPNHVVYTNLCGDTLKVASMSAGMEYFAEGTEPSCTARVQSPRSNLSPLPTVVNSKSPTPSLSPLPTNLPTSTPKPTVLLPTVTITPTVKPTSIPSVSITSIPVPTLTLTPNPTSN